MFEICVENCYIFFFNEVVLSKSESNLFYAKENCYGESLRTKLSPTGITLAMEKYFKLLGEILNLNVQIVNCVSKVNKGIWY